MGHARAVLSLVANSQNSIIKQAVAQKLSVRAIESIVRAKKQTKTKLVVGKSQDTISLENEFSEHLAADVKIHHKQNGSGKIEVKYKSLEELQGIMSNFK